MTNELDFHPYRFLLLNDAIEAALSANGPADFGSMSEPEFRCRVELIGTIKSTWNRWRRAGSEVVDFAPEMTAIAGLDVIELARDPEPKLGDPIYVHLGRAAGLRVGRGGVCIDGAYLEAGDAAGEIKVLFVCDEPPPLRRTLGTAIVAQSRIITAVLNVADAELSEIFGDVEMVESAPIASLSARLVLVLSEMNGPAPFNLQIEGVRRNGLH